MNSPKPWHADSEQRLATLTFWHSLIFLVGVSWGFGGKIYWMRNPIIYWGAIGSVLTVAGLIYRRNQGRPIGWTLKCLTPPFFYGIWVLISSFNPSSEVVMFYDTEVHRPIDFITWLPSSAIPSMSCVELVSQCGVFLSAFNIALNIGSRKRLIKFLFIAVSNATAIAVFGTVQKLGGFDIYFGLEESPNEWFFGTFIYHNHWGAYALLNVACLIGLMEPLAKQTRGRGWTNSPAMIALLGIAFLSMAIPLSTSRSSTVLLLLLLGIGLSHAFVTTRRRALENGRSIKGPMFAAGIGLISVFVFLLSVGGPILKKRIQTTINQFEKTDRQSYAAHRFLLYQDTWNIFKMRPIGGWGLETYHLTWRRFNSQPRSTDGPPIRYEEAHSDWLQSLSETGIVGTFLIALTILIPIGIVRNQFWKDSIARYLIIGALTIAGYALVEFPFANPAVTLSFWLSIFIAVRLSQLKVTHRVRNHSASA